MKIKTTAKTWCGYCRAFKKALTEALAALGCTDIRVQRGTFENYAHFTDPRGQVWEVLEWDTRRYREKITFRRTRDYSDCCGDMNHTTTFAEFESELKYWMTLYEQRPMYN